MGCEREARLLCHPVPVSCCCESLSLWPPRSGGVKPECIAVATSLLAVGRELKTRKCVYLKLADLSEM